MKLVVVGLACLSVVGCESSAPSQPLPVPNFDGLAVVERSPGARYVIDKNAELCLLVVDRAIATRVDCRVLRRSVKGVSTHLSWLRKPAAARTDDVIIASEIRKLGPNRYRISRAAGGLLIGEATMTRRGVRTVPSRRNGRSDGIKLFALRPHSAFARIGFRNGDTLQRINGHTVDLTPAKAVALFRALRTETWFSLELRRRGRNKTIVVTLD